MKSFISRIPRTPALLALLALAIYLPGFWWGAPHATAPDRTHVWAIDAMLPLGPLSEVHNIIDPKPDRSLSYPLMHFFTLAGVYAPYLAYLKLTGQLGSITGVYPFGLIDPAAALYTLSLIAKMVCVLFAVGIVLAAFYAAEALWDRHTAVLAAICAMVSYPMFFYSRAGNIDVPALFYAAAAMAVFARCITTGLTPWRALWLGVFVGFAVGTRDAVYSLFVAMPIVLLAVHRPTIDSHNQSTAGRLSWAFWKAPFAGLLGAFVAYGSGSGLFIEPHRYFAHIAFLKQNAQNYASGKIQMIHTFPFTLEGHLGLARLVTHYMIDAMTLPGLLLAGFGVAWAIRRRSIASTLVLPTLTYLALTLFWSGRVAELRYIMPAVLPLALFEARALTVFWESPKPLIRTACVMLAVGVIGLNILRGADLTYLMIYDSRYTASDWLDEHTQPGNAVAIFGPQAVQPFFKYGVVTTQVDPFIGLAPGTIRDDDESTRVIINTWQREKPRYIVIMPDYTSAPGLEHSGTCPPQVYQRLLDGSLGYRQSAHFKTPNLFAWLKRPMPTFIKRDPIITVNPSVRIFTLIGDDAMLKKCSVTTPNRSLGYTRYRSDGADYGRNMYTAQHRLRSARRIHPAGQCDRHHRHLAPQIHGIIAAAARNYKL